MINTAADTLMTRLKALVAAILAGSEPLFVGVYEDGDAIDATSLPIAAIKFGAETVHESTSKTMKTVPFTIEVVYELTADDTLNARQKGLSILGDLQAALMADRTLIVGQLTACAIDLRYAGEGTEIVPMNGEQPCATWGFVSNWEVDYRNLTLNPATIA